MKLIYLDGGVAIGYQIAGLIDNTRFAKSKQLLRLGYTYRLFPLETGSTCLIGLAFDGDADRCFVVDENGDPVSPSAICALIAERYLKKHPEATIIHNLITSKAVPEVIAENGGTAVRTRVGHSFIKSQMAETHAVFGGEHSAHYYFSEFFNADSGILAAMHILAS